MKGFVLNIGICTEISNIPSLLNTNTDYFELSMKEIMSLSEQEFNDFLLMKDEKGFCVPVLNAMLASKVNIKDCKVDTDLDHYLRVCFIRARKLRANKIIFGSPKARRRPKGCLKDNWNKVIVDFLKYAAGYASSYDIKILIEPIRYGECNAINTLAEGATIRDKVGKDSIGLMADIFHMRCNNESIIDLEKYSHIEHCHIASFKNRKCPLREDEEEYHEWIRGLRKANYRGNLSIEAGKFKEIDVFDQSISFLNELIRREFI